MERIVILAALWLIPASVSAQWLDWRTPAIPRTSDGKPNLTGPAPRTADGKPDLSGLWQPEVNPYRFNVIQDLKDEAIFRPAAEAIFMGRVVDFRRDDPVTNCLPGGPSEILNQMYRIIQSPMVVALLYAKLNGMLVVPRVTPKLAAPTFTLSEKTMPSVVGAPALAAVEPGSGDVATTLGGPKTYVMFVFP